MGPLAAQSISGIYTDFNGYWHSTSVSTSPIPNNSHNLLGFTWNGVTYFTGVDNDAILNTQLGTGNFIPMGFQAFPVASLPTPSGSSVYVGVGANYGGADDVDMGLPSGSMEYYLTDGKNGLDIGTGVYNLPLGGESKYTVVSINPDAVGDGKPDIIVAQMGDYGQGSARDIFKFVDAGGNTVGNSQTVDFYNVGAVGTGDFKFYSVSSSGNLTFTTNPTGTRPLRLVAFDFADFISTADIANIKSFVQVLSGVSDQPFIAYNNQAIVVYQTVSGYVYNETGTSGYGDIQIELYKDNIKIAETTTDNSGYYIFGDVAPGDYVVKIVLPNGATIVAAADGGTDPDIDRTITSEPVTQVNYYLNHPLPVIFGPVEAFISGNRLFVNWSTLKEQANQYFEVEASEDGSSFTSIGKINTLAAEGNSDITLDYNFSTNLGAQGLLGLSLLSALLFAFTGNFKNRKNYYLYTIFAGLMLLGVSSCYKNDSLDYDRKADLFVRIKQVDKDGTVKYSKTVKVEKR